MNLLLGGAGQGQQKLPENLIQHCISDDVMKALLMICLGREIEDNNDRAKIVAQILGREFTEIGTGTNRIAFFHRGVVFKIALDRRGLRDNYQEMKRSVELPEFLAKTYESNFLINVCEYVEVMDQDTFIENESTIKYMLKELSKAYLFDDIGFTLKNSYNWGMRESPGITGENMYDICILDYGYLYPLYGSYDKVMRCPLCRHKLQWTANYTALGCTNSTCKYVNSPSKLRNDIPREYTELEDKLIADTLNQSILNFSTVEQELRKDTGKGE